MENHFCFCLTWGGKGSIFLLLFLVKYCFLNKLSCYKNVITSCVPKLTGVHPRNIAIGDLTVLLNVTLTCMTMKLPLVWFLEKAWCCCCLPNKCERSSGATCTDFRSAEQCSASSGRTAGHGKQNWWCLSTHRDYVCQAEVRIYLKQLIINQAWIRSWLIE